VMGFLVSGNSNLAASLKNQDGLLLQDISDKRNVDGRSHNISTNVNFSKLQKNRGNSFSGNLGISSNRSISDQLIDTRTLYYNNVTRELQKDSLLSRNILSENSGERFSVGLSYNIGFKRSKKDSLLRHSLSLNYQGSISNNNNQILTYVQDNDLMPKYVDSLSSLATSLSVNQSLGISFNRSRKNARLSVGINAVPIFIRSHYPQLGQTVTNNQFNYAPTLGYNQTLSKGKTININYNGGSTAPSLSQMQPVRNTQNLQNIIIGNPDLRPYFSHQVSASYNYIEQKTGMSFLTRISASAIQDQIVSNVILIPDTLNAFKTETRYLNTNGNSNVSGQYSVNLPLKKNKLSLSYTGTLGTFNRPAFINNIRRFNSGTNLSQRFGGNLNLKTLSIGTAVGYAYNSSTNVINTSFLGEIYDQALARGTTFFQTHNYTFSVNGNLRLKKLTANFSTAYSSNRSINESAPDLSRTITNLNTTMFTQLTVRKSYFITVSASQQRNWGFREIVNPVLINASLRKSFMKNRALSLNINANDLLNQGNNLSRTISGNSIIDNRSNLVTRVISASVTYNLSKFGGKNIRVDPDM
ncbi:MAG: hypothetical protein EOO89_19390, partial [Pedobacter sp.]